ncbi:MAG: prepilin-type N-terminal cleavage/methylation domain-containing protein [Kofleriaceae bacterium]
MNRQSQRGFTLVEVMMVVVIIAVLSTLAIVYMKPTTKPVDVATRFGNLVEEANRTAVRLGVVRADVATAQGSKRRTRITATNTPVTFSLEVLSEDPTPTWTTVETYRVPTQVTPVGFVKLVGTHAVLSATPGLTTNWSTLQVSCFPNGTCDAATLFFSSTKGPTRDQQARVSVLPLGSSSYVINAWN